MALEVRLISSGPARQAIRPLPDWATVHAEHKQSGVNRQLLWLECKAAHPDGYQYTQFCAHYTRWRATLDPVLRQEYRAGERVLPRADLRRRAGGEPLPLRRCHLTLAFRAGKP